MNCEKGENQIFIILKCWGVLHIAKTIIQKELSWVLEGSKALLMGMPIIAKPIEF